MLFSLLLELTRVIQPFKVTMIGEWLVNMAGRTPVDNQKMLKRTEQLSRSFGGVEGGTEK
jgi:hypothetical protein